MQFTKSPHSDFHHLDYHPHGRRLLVFTNEERIAFESMSQAQQDDVVQRKKASGEYVSKPVGEN